MQLIIEAYDSAYPNNRASTSVTIEVRRNENRPEFPSGRVNLNVVEYVALGTIIGRVNATDVDQVSLGYIKIDFSDCQLFHINIVACLY